MNAIRRILKSSVEKLLINWDPGLKEQIQAELSEQPPFMSIQRVAKVCDISETTVRRYIKNGDLVAIESDGPNTARVDIQATNV